MTTRAPSKTADQRPPLALIAGPTASGKSDLALRLAEALARRGKPAVIVNADSAQVYADLAILSARPPRVDMDRVPHRLFGEWDGARACSAADWAAAARDALAQAWASGAVPILVGGTGLYIRTLLDGIAPVPPIDPAIRAEIRALPVAEARALLEREDPERARALGTADIARIGRALEVVRSTGRTLAQWQAERVGGIAGSVSLHPLILLPPRAGLYQRCDQRFAAMLAHGALEEVAALLGRGLDPGLPVMRAIGVAALAGYLDRRWPLAEAERQGAQATRNYAKRQYTWLRHQPPAAWPRTEQFDVELSPYFDIIL